MKNNANYYHDLGTIRGLIPKVLFTKLNIILVLSEIPVTILEYRELFTLMYIFVRATNHLAASILISPEVIV
jgi:hypothetical protein